ncbi:hypothetical protein GGX14DRAFT_560624 [Mycena pura]|uniref:Uncharacterized protein n=1 Tax=Mycena pura TaxID=153505 RepID=A0AAD6VR40_9AGAR|nr:hypothetical protein GGX14DRAFT_560624 [Mycena pura]
MAYFNYLQDRQDRNSRFQVVGAEVDADSDDPFPNQALRMKAAIKDALAHGYDEAQAKHDAWMEILQSRHNPLTLTHIQAIKVCYVSLVKLWSPDILADDYWREDVVKKHTPLCVSFYARSAKGTGSRLHIKASTLLSFVNRLISQIAHFAHSADGNKVGMLLLCKGGLYDILQDETYTLINELGLDRHQNEKLVFGDLELLFIIQTALTNSMSGSIRLAKIQDITIALLFFFTGIRPSSLGPTHAKYRDEGKYPKLRNVVIERTGVLNFRTKLCIADLKGYFGAAGSQVVFNIASPQMWSHVFLDFNLFFIAYLVERGAIEGVSTMEELINGAQSELRIKPEKSDEPLFCKTKPGGRGLDTSSPMMSKGLSEVTTAMAQAAGLLGGSAYCYRRNAANVVANIMGKDATEMVLAHRRPGSLHHYQVQATNMELTALMTGEQPDLISPMAQSALNLQRMDSPAVSTMLCAMYSNSSRHILQMQNAKTLAPVSNGENLDEADGEDLDEDTPNVKKATDMATTISTKRTRRQDLDKADLDEIENTPELVELKRELHLQIESYKAMFTNYTGRGAAITVNAMSRYAGAAELKNKVRDQDKVDPALERIQALGSTISKTRRRLKKNMDRKKKVDARHKQLETSHSALAFPGTMQDRQGVRDALNTSGANLVKSVINHADAISVTGSSSDLAGTKEPLSRSSASASGSVSSGSAGPSLSASTSSHLTAVVSSTTSTAAEPGAGPSSSASTSSHPLVSSTISTGTQPVYEKYLTGTSADVELDTTNLLSFFNEDEEHDLQLDVSVDIVRCHSSLINHAGKNPKRVELQPSTVNEDDPTEFLAQGLQTQAGPDGIISVDVPAVDALTKAVPKDNLDLEARKAFLRFLVFPLQVERCVDKCKTADGFQCPKCQQYTHDPEWMNKVFLTRVNMTRHLQYQHSEWADMEIEAAKVNDSGELRYHCICCPSLYDMMALLRLHCRRQCQAKEFFNRLHLDDTMIREARSDKAVKPEVHSSGSTIVKEMSLFLSWEKDLLAACEDSNEEEELRGIIHRVKQMKTNPPTEEQIEQEVDLMVKEHPM